MPLTTCKVLLPRRRFEWEDAELLGLSRWEERPEEHLLDVVADWKVGSTIVTRRYSVDWLIGSVEFVGSVGEVQVSSPEWPFTPRCQILDGFSTVLRVEFIESEGEQFVRVFLDGVKYDVKLTIDDEQLVCWHVYRVDNETKLLLGFSWGSLVRLSNINDPSSISVDFILEGSLLDDCLVTSVVYQPEWRCFVYALDDGSIKVVNDKDKQEVFHQTAENEVDDLFSVDTWLVIVSKENSWLLGYGPSTGAPIAWWRRNDVTRLIDGSETNERLFKGC